MLTKDKEYRCDACGDVVLVSVFVDPDGNCHPLRMKEDGRECGFCGYTTHCAPALSMHIDEEHPEKSPRCG